MKLFGYTGMGKRLKCRNRLCLNDRNKFTSPVHLCDTCAPNVHSICESCGVFYRKDSRMMQLSKQSLYCSLCHVRMNMNSSHSSSVCVINITPSHIITDGHHDFFICGHRINLYYAAHKTTRSELFNHILSLPNDIIDMIIGYILKMKVGKIPIERFLDEYKISKSLLFYKK